MCQEYNGWTNYQTWNVALWLDNDEGLYNLVREWAEECEEDYELANRIKDMIEENNPLADHATLWTDLLGHAISQVDWFEIAEHYREDE